MSPLVLSFSSSPKSPKKRATSYGGLGGLVTIKDLQNDHVNDKDRFSWAHRKRRNISAPSGGEQKQLYTDNDVIMAPSRSEGWPTPETPPTPTLSPLASDVSPIRIDLHSSDVLSDPSHANASGASKCSLYNAPVELAGSLLMPSQGFSQTNPPLVPPRRHPPLRKSSEESTYSSLPSLSTSSSPDTEMSNPMATTNSFSQHRGMMTRTSTQVALHANASESSMTLRSGCPIPLSQMGIEDLMAILPNLDAAIIALDWIPCMQKRHKELKRVYEQFVANDKGSNEGLKDLDKDLLTILKESQHLATTFKDLFKDAEQLSAMDDEGRTAAAKRTSMQLSECLRVLARQNTEKKEQATQYAIELKEYQHKTRNMMNMFSNFIHENLGEALSKAPTDQVHKIIHVMADSAGDWMTPGDTVDASSHATVREALQDCQDELHDAREIVYEQQTMIRTQSRKLDEYHDRFAAVATKARKQEQQVHSYQKAIDELRAHCAQDQKMVDQLRAHLDDEHETNLELHRANNGLAHTEQRASSQESLKDAEISNLRRKLEKAYRQENKLQAQMRDLIAAGNKPDTPSEIVPKENPETRPGLLKRLFASHSKDTQAQPSGIPRDVSKLVLSLPNSPRHTDLDRMSTPTDSISSHLGTSCDPSGTRLTRQSSNRSRQGQSHQQRRNSFELPARLREALNAGQGGAPEITDAVLNRFVSSVPPGVQSRQQQQHLEMNIPMRTKSDDGIVHIPSHAYIQGVPVRHRPRHDTQPEPGARELDDTPVQLSAGHHARTPTPTHHDRESPFGASHNRVLSGITEVSEHSHDQAGVDQGHAHGRSRSHSCSHSRVASEDTHGHAHTHVRTTSADARNRGISDPSQSLHRENSGPLPASASDIQIYRQSLNTLERLYF